MRVLLVDDDPLVRIALKTLIEWEKLGYELVGEASNGIEALHIIEEKTPDIVVSDMKMPQMNGIEMLEEINLLADPPSVVILSSYDDFHLVKEAMRLGADDYILKLSITPENLIKVLDRISDKIINREGKADNADMSRQITKNISAMRRNFLRDVISGLYTSDDFKESATLLDIHLRGAEVYCMAIKIDELYRFQDISSKQLHILNFSIINIAEEIMGDLFHSYCFEGKTGEFFVIACEKEHQQGTIEILIEYGELLVDMLKQYININSKIGIGQGGNNYSGVCDAYNKAVSAIKQRFFKGNKKVILWDNFFINHKMDEDYSVFAHKDDIFKAITFHEQDQIKNILNIISNELALKRLSQEVILNGVLELFYIISEGFEQNGVDIKAVLIHSHCSYFEIMHIESIVDVQKWIQIIIEDIVNYMESNKEDTPAILSKMKRYIDEHYTEEITLSEVAKFVNLHPSYISSLLKIQTGMNYSKYVMHIRIEEAKRLLKETNLKIYEVGEEVGYTNAFYFNRIFKKHTGRTPGEYREGYSY